MSQLSDAQEIDKFNKNHPFPGRVGIKSLFRFFRFEDKYDDRYVENLSDLFVNRKLYHSPPKNFNDPFECKPHYIFPKKLKEVVALRNHIIRTARNGGSKRKEAESIASTVMDGVEHAQGIITEAIHGAFDKLRICSFTTQKENLLFWSHYASSHKGFCVEFDATKVPIDHAFRVRYENQYPAIKYPVPTDSRLLIPALIKSKAWSYEEEFRTIIFPGGGFSQPRNDGESMILTGEEIKNIYFGADMKDKKKELLIDLINRGPFQSGLWDSKISKSSFMLEFIEHN